MLGAALDAIGAAAGAEPVSDEESSLPQAAREIEKIETAARAVSFIARMVRFLQCRDFHPLFGANPEPDGPDLKLI
jgi:hypothetical protein